MKLFLASEAKNPKSLKKLEEYIGGFKNKTITYIPTAANGEGWESWKQGGSWNLIQTLGAKINLVLLEEHRNSSVVNLIKGKDIIWFAGGSAGYLLYWLRRCELADHLKEILAEGTIYVGSSAGSMITYKNINLVSWYIGENEPGAEVIPGLNLVDFEIYPHYEDKLFTEIKTRYLKSKGKKLYLLKNDEVIIVEDGNIKIIGEERLLINNSNDFI